MGIDWRYGKAFFIVGRTAGLAAHACEEQTTGWPFQFAVRIEAEYIGPAERPLPPAETF